MHSLVTIFISIIFIIEIVHTFLPKRHFCKSRNSMHKQTKILNINYIKLYKSKKSGFFSAFVSHRGH